MSEGTSLFSRLIGVILNAYSLYPLIRAQVQFPEGWLHSFLVWVALVGFLLGIILNIIGGFYEPNTLNQTGLILEAVATLLATPEILVKKRAYDEEKTHKITRILLVIAVVIFIIGLTMEFIVSFQQNQGGYILFVDRIGLFLTFLAFFPFIVLDFYKDEVDRYEDTIDLVTWGTRFLFIAFSVIFLAVTSPYFQLDDLELWQFPFVLLIIGMVQEVLYQMKYESQVTAEMKLFSFGVTLVYVGYHFQLVPILERIPDFM